MKRLLQKQKSNTTKRSINNGPSFEIEAGLFAEGFKVIAGIDEAGRGSLAGPLSLGLVIYDSSLYTQTVPQYLELINDSKKLTPHLREKMRSVIAEKSLVSVYHEVSVEDVDLLNVNGATLAGVRALIAKSPVKPDCVIMDGNFNFELSIPFVPVIKGDSLSISIASASIEAKVTRDMRMNQLDEIYPGYGFAVHKGYGTAFHREEIVSRGPSAVHRKSYEPVKSMINQVER